MPYRFKSGATEALGEFIGDNDEGYSIYNLDFGDNAQTRIVVLFHDRDHYIVFRIDDKGAIVVKPSQRLGDMLGGRWWINSEDEFKAILKPYVEIIPRSTEAISKAIGKKATRLAIDDVYEAKTGKSSKPGTGPADLIREFAGVQPPKGTGRKTRRRRKSSRRNR